MCKLHIIFAKLLSVLANSNRRLYIKLNLKYYRILRCAMAKINGNEIRPGYVLEHNDGLWVAVKVNHVKPGKGGAFAQVEMKNLRNGSKLNER